MTYTPKNNWHFNGTINKCYTPKEFEEIEQDYTFSGQDIYINSMGCSGNGKFSYDITFMGANLKGSWKLDAPTQAIWNTMENDQYQEQIEFEEAKAVLSWDRLGEVYENPELFK